MPSFFDIVKRSKKTWFSLFLTLILFSTILVTQFATTNVRDNRSSAASCASGQSIATFRPSGNFQNGNFSQSPASGSFFDKVDESGAGDGDNTFIWDDTIGSSGGGNSVVLFNKPTFSWSGKVIHSVKMTVNSKEGVSSVAYFNMALHNGANLHMTQGYGAGPDYELDVHTWNTSPFTGSAWSGTEVNNLKIGLNSYRTAQSNPLTVTQLYIDVCYTNAPAPTLNLTADKTSITYNTSTVIRWSTTNATSCSISPNGWTGTSGDRSTGNLTSTSTYTGNCSGAGGSVSKQVTVQVGAPPAPNPPPVTPPVKPPAKPPSSPPAKPPSSPPIVIPPNAGPSQQPTAGADDISLSFTANPFLSGPMDITISIDGTSYSEKSVVNKDGGALVIKPAGLTKNTNYQMKIYSKNSLINIINFKYINNTTTTIPVFVTGDFNADNSIDQSDLLLFVPRGIESNEGIFDLNYDGVVNSVDYSLLLLNQGKKG